MEKIISRRNFLEKSLTTAIVGISLGGKNIRAGEHPTKTKTKKTKTKYFLNCAKIDDKKINVRYRFHEEEHKRG